MGLFDRFQKKAEPAKPPEAARPQWPQPPRPYTSALLLMDRVLEDIDPVAEHLRTVFGSASVSEVDHSHPRVSAFTATVDGLEFWVSYLPMPVPPSELDVPAAAKYSFLLTEEEKAAFTAHKSFWLLAQKDGGTSLPEKRRVCWAFSLLCAALLEMEGAVGVNPVGRGGLLVSKRQYMQQREQMEGKGWDNSDGYFPVPLWVWVYGATEGDKFILQTTGLKDFGLPELGFYNSKKTVDELLNYLYTMSSFQITGRQLYRNMALVPLDEKTQAVCKQDGDTLFFIEA